VEKRHVENLVPDSFPPDIEERPLSIAGPELAIELVGSP
jgi:hypothetical protein